MSNKLAKVTDEQRKQQEDEKYLQGKPNRMEVANYVNGLMEEHYMPDIMNNFSNTHQAMQLGFMTIQAILIQKGICTEDEIKSMTEEFIRLQSESEKSKDSKESQE